MHLPTVYGRRRYTLYNCTAGRRRCSPRPPPTARCTLKPVDTAAALGSGSAPLPSLPQRWARVSPLVLGSAASPFEATHQPSSVPPVALPRLRTCATTRLQVRRRAQRRGARDLPDDLPHGVGAARVHAEAALAGLGHGLPQGPQPAGRARGAAAGRRSSGDGSGLGLALVAEHVRLHKGIVWVEDRRDGQPGARFVIELPAEEVEVE